jgi:hypothetical protein
MKMPQIKLFNLSIPLFLIFFGTNSCGSSSSAEIPQTEIPFTVLLDGSHSNMKEQKNLVVHDKNELQRILGMINSTRKPGIPMPDIDFNEKTVLFLNAGESSTGGTSIAVDKILQQKDKLVVVVGGKSPKPGDFVATVITQPFTMVSFNKTELPIVFKLKNQ